eukprot:TRINITY_DN7799_c0_g1_i2.p1 TRINITY_DN7799_c0_g1~~TRINITY_DN7799_c0_g1_i2.p1  ORF type:complete len:462 (-),score=82.93 TRINITY_DN7799_c0_g1_i2:379-1590(-)
MALLALAACTGFMGMHLLAASAARLRPRLPEGEYLTVASACKLADAREIRLAMEVGIVLACSGALVTSLIIVGDSLAPLGFLSREMWITGVFLAVAFPLSFFSQISFLRFSSYLSFVMMLYIALLMFTRATTGSCPAEEEGSEWPREAFRWGNGLKIFQTIPVFTFCMCGHMSIFSIAAELQDATVKRISFVIFAATVCATAIFGVVAASAVFCFGNLTPQDMLSSYPQTPVVVGARAGMAVVCCGFFPLLVQPIRTTVLGWIESALAAGWDADSQDDAKEPLVSDAAVQKGYDMAVKHTLNIAYRVVTCLIGGFSLCLALATSSLGLVFSLSGATGFALLCNVCPPWLYLTVAPRRGHRCERIGAWALLAFGLLMMPICITANFMAALPPSEVAAVRSAPSS